eukprot:GHUV01034765.1.p2 GENE.GHUV01034765.1~~GHUV01034765.1.p2  ORF type:complete len:127 (-),score=41.46 GHUV01034765.1:304-684(-)
MTPLAQEQHNKRTHSSSCALPCTQLSAAYAYAQSDAADGLCRDGSNRNQGCRPPEREALTLLLLQLLLTLIPDVMTEANKNDVAADTNTQREDESQHQKPVRRQALVNHWDSKFAEQRIFASKLHA